MACGTGRSRRARGDEPGVHADFQAVLYRLRLRRRAAGPGSDQSITVAISTAAPTVAAIHVSRLAQGAAGARRRRARSSPK